MPRSLDTAAREQAVIEAAWQVIAREGVAALTVRRVAAEAGLPPSSLRYTFPTQASVRERAIARVLHRMEERVAGLPTHLGGREWARAALLELLPLDPPRRLEMEVSLALGAAAMTDAGLRRLWDEANAVVREVCSRAAAAIEQEDPVQVDALHALVDGLALHLVTQAQTADPSWAIAVIDHHLT